MLTYKEIMNYCSNYRIENGIVIDKKTNTKVLDEEIILKVKSAVLIFRESKDSYQSDIQQFGKTNKSQEDYIRKTMEKFGTNNEENNFGVNKLIRAISESNGHYEEYTSSGDLINTKFSILVEPKKEYGLAYLRLKFREKGLDIESLNVSQDLTELQHNGVSKVIIDFKVKKYDKNIQNANQSNSNFYQHPRAKDLNELEKLKQIAKQDNDQDGYNYAVVNIERIIRENPATISDDEFNKMDIEGKISFIQVKINEAKILHDKKSFEYWNAKLTDLKNKKSNETPVKEESIIVNANHINNDLQMENSKEEKKDYRYYYLELKKVIKRRQEAMQNRELTPEEKKHFMEEIYYYEPYLIDAINNEIEANEIVDAIYFDLRSNELDRNLQNDIYDDIQDKLRRIKDKESMDSEENKSQEQTEESSNITFINNIRNYEIKEILNLYNQMLLNGIANESEINNLIKRMEIVREVLVGMSSSAENEEERNYYEDTIKMVKQKIQEMSESKNRSNQSNFMIQISNLKNEINKVREEYKEMLADGHIDDEELDILINRMRNLSDRAISIQSMANNDKERYILLEIIDEIDRELKKMITFRNKIEDSIRRFKN